MEHSLPHDVRIILVKIGVDGRVDIMWVRVGVDGATIFGFWRTFFCNSLCVLALGLNVHYYGGSL